MSTLREAEKCALSVIVADERHELVGLVLKADPEGSVVLVESTPFGVKPGVTVRIAQESVPDAGWARIAACITVKRKLAVRLSRIIWESEISARSARQKGLYRCLLTFVDTSEGEAVERRTVGETVDISATGARIRSRSPLQIGTEIWLKLFVHGSIPTEILCKVVRFAQAGGNTQESGEVGVQFLSITSGFEHLAPLLGDEASKAPIQAVGVADTPNAA